MAPAETPSQTVGPFFSIGLCDRPSSELVSRDTPGAVRIGGRVLDGAGEPVPDALVEIWSADADGRYGQPNESFSGWGRCETDALGEFSFLTLKPGPVDGQAPHLVLMVFARGLLRQVLTRMYFPDEAETNATDPVLSSLMDPQERATLVAAPDEDGLRFDVRLQGERQTVFFAV